MAQRRMFSISIIDSDAFIDMPPSAQLLYFHLAMRADDDGFINNPKRITRMLPCSEKDFKTLVNKRFIITFESGVAVIKHWKIHNHIQKDRYKGTFYKEEKSKLTIKENGSYTELDTNCIQYGYNTDTQVRLGKDSIGKDSLGKINTETEKAVSDVKKKEKHKYGLYQNVLLSNEEIQKLKDEFPLDFENRIEALSEYMECHGKKYKSHLATIRAWARKEKREKEEEKESKAKNEYDDFVNALISLRTEE